MPLAALPFELRTVFMGCAALGGAVLLLQMALLLLGGSGGDFDADAEAELDHDDGSLGLLSIRALAAFLAFFGLAGWYGVAEGWNTGSALIAASGAGLTMMFAVAWLMAQFKKLESQGNVQPERAVGQEATVYLRIPGARAGEGKITVSVQGRRMQFQAVTAGPELPTGSAVRVLRMTGPSAFEVAAVDALSARS